MTETTQNQAQEQSPAVPTPTLEQKVAFAPLPTDVQTLIEARLSNEKKSTAVSYLLWFFLGSFGAHHFYLGKPILGLGYLACAIIGVATAMVGVGYVFLALLIIGLIIDLFRIPSLIRKNLDKKREEYVDKYRRTGTIN